MMNMDFSYTHMADVLSAADIDAFGEARPDKALALLLEAARVSAMRYSDTDAALRAIENLRFRWHVGSGDVLQSSAMVVYARGSIMVVRSLIEIGASNKGARLTVAEGFYLMEARRADGLPVNLPGTACANEEFSGLIRQGERIYLRAQGARRASECGKQRYRRRR